MAYNLEARLTLNDRFSSRLNRVTKNMKKAERQSKQLTRDIASIGSSAVASTKSVGSLTKSFIGLGTAIGGAMAAKKLFDKTIVAAAKYEQSEVIIRAMFEENGAAENYIKRMQELAVDSPLLNSQDIFANSKGFLSFSQEMGTLEKMWGIAERLIATSPEQGVEGAVFALKELFSGDALSIMRRFEVGTKGEWNAIKKLSVEDQVGALDELLTKYRITDKLIDDMGDNTLGIWNQIKEKTDIIMRTIGQPALMKIKEFLDKLNRDMEKGDKSGFIKFGQDVLSTLTEGFLNGVTGLSNVINGTINDPEFISAKGINGKAKFLLDKFYEGMNNWLDGGGRDRIQEVTNSIVKTVVKAIEDNTGTIVDTAIIIGGKIGGGIVDGFRSALANSPLGQFIIGTIGGAAIGSVVPGVGTAAGAVIGGGGSIIKSGSKKLYDFLTPWDDKKLESRASGLSYVPYNGYGANLHKGERILTPEENREYSYGNKGVNITGNTFVVRKESDIDAIGEALFRKMHSAWEGGA
jgi:hypothetical protein